MGWVAEAKPWQIPPEVWSKVGVILFLDYDNCVNYLRLLSRGNREMAGGGVPNAGLPVSHSGKSNQGLGLSV